MQKKILLISGLIIIGFALTSLQKVQAHCVTMNGPVITAANEALKTGNVNLILIWVKPGDEAEIKALFEKTLQLRKINTDVQQLADRNFFENLVRIHRSGEGCPCEGIKEFREIEPHIAEIDKAIEQGKIDSILQQLNTLVNNKVNREFHVLISKKAYNKNDVKAGREYVESYVRFMHYVEGLYKTAQGENYGECKMHFVMPARRIQNAGHICCPKRHMCFYFSTHKTQILIILCTLIIIGFIFLHKHKH